MLAFTPAGIVAMPRAPYPFSNYPVRSVRQACAGILATLTLGVTAPVLAQANAAPPPRKAAAPLTTAQLVERVDEYMQAAVRNAHFSGTILIARDGVPLVSRAYGMSNYELRTPNTTATVYQLASLSKQFTATLIMQLQEQGKLKVSDPLCKFLMSCPVAWRLITLRHLLTHTAGVPGFTRLPNWDEELGHRAYTRGTLMALFRDLPLEFTPGEKYRYSNSGYALLGMVIERVTGRGYGDALRTNITEPLGMALTIHHESRALVEHRANGYYSLGTSFINARHESPTTSIGSTGILSTTTDLLRWDQALYSDQLLSKASREEMFTPVLNGYGYGWQVGESLGRARVDHSGSQTGFSTYIVRFLNERLTVIVLSNSDRASGAGTGMDLARIAFGEPYALPKLPLRDRLYDAIVARGVIATIAEIKELRRTEPTVPLEETLLYLGYDLLEARRLSDAITMFEYNISLHPRAAYNYDGLADAALAVDDIALAKRHFETSLKIDPKNRYAIDALQRLRR
jgi:CubicO group peptidase (beta-lactamase class C family)